MNPGRWRENNRKARKRSSIPGCDCEYGALLMPFPSLQPVHHPHTGVYYMVHAFGEVHIFGVSFSHSCFLLTSSFSRLMESQQFILFCYFQRNLEYDRRSLKNVILTWVSSSPYPHLSHGVSYPQTTGRRMLTVQQYTLRKKERRHIHITLITVFCY